MTIENAEIPKWGKASRILKQIERVFEIATDKENNYIKGTNCEKQSAYLSVYYGMNIMFLWFKILNSQKEIILNRSDEFVVAQNIFQKFVDGKRFQSDIFEKPEKWSKRAKNAASLVWVF